MADQYQNFSNPTIIPEQKYGWQAASQSMSDLTKSATGYLIDQHKKIQDLQLQQAQDLSKFKTLDQVYYGGAHGQHIDSLLAQNPYGRQLISQGSLGQSGGQGQGSPMGSIANGAQYIGMNGSMPSPGSSVMPNPYDASQPNTGGASMSPVNTISGGPVVTGMTQKAFEPPSISIANPQGEAAVSQAKAAGSAAAEIPAGYAKEIMSSKAKEAAASTTLEGLTRNLVADLKSSFIESGGGGPVKGAVAGLSTHFGMSPATYGLKNTQRDSAIAYARNLAGGSQGVQKLFQLILDTIPGESATPEQAGTAALQMHLTGRQLQSGMENLKLQPEDMKNMSEQQIQQVLSAGTIDRAKETAAFTNILKEIVPTKITDIEGNARESSPNPIAKAMGWNYQGGSQNPVINKQQTQGKQIDINTARQLLQQAGGDKNKARQMAQQMGYTL